MPKLLEAHERAMQKVLSDDFVFSIPEFQRPYAWTTEQAEELIEDLLGFIESNPGEVADMPAYFLGSIVLIQNDTPDALVVDGQQRLTTLTLLLSAVRANISGDKDLITKRIYERGDKFSGTQDRYLLTLRERDREFFQKYVQRESGFPELLKLEEGLSDSQVNLRNNARLYQDRLSKLSEPQRMELASFILQRCYLVVVTTPDVESAYRIFNVLNSRGLDLAPTDILKAQIIRDVPTAQRAAYNKKWEDTEEDLGRDNFNTLFGHIRTVYRKAKAKETLLKEFTAHVTELKNSVQFIDSVLVPMADAFGDITACTYEATRQAGPINEMLRWLNRLEFNDWVPPALAFMVRHRQDPDATLEFFKDLERLAYFLLLTRQGVNPRIERFAEVTDAVEKNFDLKEEDSPLQLTPTERFKFYKCLNGPIYNDLGSRSRTSVLMRVDRLMGDASAAYDHTIVSVEHVLPQNPEPESEWVRWFPDPAERARTVHILGNLTLLSRRKNSAASNYEFERKKESYFKRGGISAFAMTSEILTHPKWIPSVVKARQKRILDLLEGHWRLQGRLSEDETLLAQLGISR